MASDSDVPLLAWTVSSRYVAHGAIQDQLTRAFKDGNFQADLGDAQYGERGTCTLLKAVAILRNAPSGPKTKVRRRRLVSKACDVQHLTFSLELLKSTYLFSRGDSSVNVCCQEDRYAQHPQP